MREDTEQQTVIIQLTPPIEPQLEPQRSSSRWMRYFITDDVSPDNALIIELQRRACWIGLAMIFQAINEIPPFIYLPVLPFLAPWIGLISFSLITGSFFALWMAFRPATLKLQNTIALTIAQRVIWTAFRSLNLKSRQTKTIPAQKDPRHWQRVIVVLLLITSLAGAAELVSSVVMDFFMTPIYRNDGTSLDTNAAALLLEGRDPYLDSSILSVVRRFPILPDWTTPLREGQLADSIIYPTSWELRSILDTDLKAGSAPEFESKVSYPALSFLTLLPFIWLHTNNVLPLYLLCYFLIIFVGWKKLRPEMRPWLILVAMANASMWTSVMNGSVDILYILLILLAWLLRDARWWSAIFLGLALATKQLAWFFVPFYAILTWRRYGLREAMRRLSIAGGIMLAINLPFILWNPQAWIMGVLAPVVDPMFPLGVGLVALSSTPVLPILPAVVYTTLEALAMLFCLAWYWRICKSHPEAAMLLAVLPLFFAWRSLSSYFCCSALPLFILQVARVLPKRDDQSRRARLPIWNVQDIRAEASNFPAPVGARAALQTLRFF
ncbi:MAG TPA: glycosyltransferase 87 family protein [Ktedonobacteraceae bacterium]|nr:glycosyltransferase 87 family protein [Ktedonobacteraceae bacterium]